MATVEQISIGVTTEGLEDIANMIATGTVFTIGYFRMTALGDSDHFNSKKGYRSVDPEAYYIDYSADDFEDDHPEGAIDLSAYGIGDSSGYVSVNSVELLDSTTVEVNCYLPPAAGATPTINEIMVYTGEGTLASPYRSFVWGIFPPITKVAKYGINFRILVQL